jgi:hypothetical protein
MSNDERLTNFECSEGGSSNSEHSEQERTHYNLVIRICFVIRHSDFVILHIRVIRG